MAENVSQIKNIASELSTSWIGKTTYYYPEVGSTNDILREMANADEVSGTMAITDYQSRGKGRLDRSWIAPPGTSLLFSLLLKPTWPIERMNWLVMLAGLSVVEAIEKEAGLKVGLKWPNDVVVYQAEEWRKVAGILLETAVVNDKYVEAVVGIGINVNQVEADFEDSSQAATSLRIASGRPVSRFALLDDCLIRFEQRYEKAEAGESPQPDWNKRLVNLGNQVTVVMIYGHDQISGRAIGTNSMGWLLLKDEAGKVHEFPAGDVTMAG